MAKILFITTRLPYPTNEGHQIRTYNLLKRICQVHDVHYLSLQRKDDDASAKQHLSSLCKSVTTFNIPSDHSKLRFLSDLALGFLTKLPFVVRKYFSKELQYTIKQKLNYEHFDLVHFDMLPLAQYASCLGTTPYVLNNHNVESLLLKRRAENSNSILEKVFFNNQSKSLHHFEITACQNAKETFVCSKNDVATLKTMAPLANFSVVENGVDIHFFAVDKVEKKPHSLVFVGGMGWFPNKDGMIFFINEVMPRLIKQCPTVKLTLVGKSTGVDIPETLRNNIQVTGFVHDFRPIVTAASVYILPIRVGSGTRLKLLEAMSMAKAIVSTNIGAEGVELEQDNNIMYANSAAEFSASIIELFENNDKVKALGDSARIIAETQYDWDIITKKLLGSYEQII
jgi:glycosyltransferase involved in cell wall biosynthesis